MLPHQERVVGEKKDLDEKVSKLTQFVLDNNFLKVPKDERDRLRKQLVIMNSYSVILGERISAF